MEHAALGRTSLQVSRITLGTMTFGLQCDERTSIEILDHAFDAGVTFIDTADSYPLGGTLETVGRTEELLGRWLAGRRQRVVLATKCGNPMSARREDRGASRKHILDAIDASLKRLRTDHVDLYQLHLPDPETPIDETLRAFDEVVKSGRARYVGCSNFLAYKVARSLGRSEVLGTVRFDTLQPRYNLMYRAAERELLPLALEENLGVIPFNPIAGGLLAGKHRRESPPPQGSRFTLGTAAQRYQDRYWHERAFDTVEAVRAVAREAGLDMVTLAVAWVLAHPAVTSAIIGASRAEQLKPSLAAASVKLPPDVKARLDAISAEHRRDDTPF
jgi:aryl-alcohol dehydrogenase (NADP+)